MTWRSVFYFTATTLKLNSRLFKALNSFKAKRKLSRWFSVCLCPIIFSFRIFYTAYILHETIYLYNFRLLDFIDFVMNKWYNIMFIPNNIWLSCRFIGSLTSRFQPDIKYCNVQLHSWELQSMIAVIE